MIMTKYVYRNGFHFIGRFSELMEQLSAMENKQITLLEYIQTYKNKLN